MYYNNKDIRKVKMSMIRQLLGRKHNNMEFLFFRERKRRKKKKLLIIR